MSETKQGTILDGPIKFMGYEHLRLAVDHTVVLPNGQTFQAPSGTILMMNTPSGYIEQEGGTATNDKPVTVDGG